MKKFVLLSTLLVISLLSVAQVSSALTEGQSSLVYALPKTRLCIEVETEKVSQKPGMFYRYSERYLASSNVITEEKISYRLKAIRVKALAVPDSSRTYSVIPDKKSQLSHLAVNTQGILCGVNVSCLSEPVSPIHSKTGVTDDASTTLLPLGEEYMMAGSEAKLAEGAAKQIYRIRESRLSLLTADVEKLPADGASFKSMLAGMNKMERELTELFTGKIDTESQVQKLYLVPVTALDNQVLFRFSALRGVVSVDDLSGAPYYISINPTSIPVADANPKAKKEKVGIYYVLPVSAQITIGDGINTSFSDQYYISQFGKILSLPESLFQQSAIKVHIDPQTGRLLNVE